MQENSGEILVARKRWTFAPRRPIQDRIQSSNRFHPSEAYRARRAAFGEQGFGAKGMRISRRAATTIIGVTLASLAVSMIFWRVLGEAGIVIALAIFTGAILLALAWVHVVCWPIRRGTITLFWKRRTPTTGRLRLSLSFVDADA
jgi:hypothetical protein